MIVAICVVAVSFQPGVLSQEQQDAEMAKRRFRQSIHVYLGRSKAKTRLSEMLAEQAESLNLPDEKLKRLQSSHKDAISSFVHEQAAIWADKKLNSRLFRAQSSSLTKSTYMIEKSAAWQTFLSSVLTDEEVARWNEGRERVFQSDKAEFKALEKQIVAEELQRAQQQQRQAIFMARRLTAQQVPLAQLTNQREMMLNVCRELANAEEQSIQGELNDEIQWLADAYQLNDKQVRKLQLAARGVSKKRVRSFVARIGDIEAETTSDEPTAEAQAEELLDIMTKLLPTDLPPVPGLPQAVGQLPRPAATAEPLWSKAIKSTLTDAQRANYVEESASRTNFRRDAIITWLILAIDRDVRLRQEQRKRLMTLFSTYEGSLSPFEKVPPADLYDSLPDSLADSVNRILTQKQRDLLSDR